MRALPKWIEKIHEPNDKIDHLSIHSICYNTDGTYLIVAAGDRVLIYEPSTGNLIETLRGHKDTIHSVACARDGKKFASASADKTVIIWTNKFEGLLKYSHNDSVQCLAFNPVSHQLASCAVSDFAFWSTEQKAVQKHKVQAKVNTCAWTNDGQYLALGLASGVVSIRNKAGEEKNRIERSSPVFGLSWSPPSAGISDILCVVDWSKQLCFYNLGGQLMGKERSLNFDPLCLNYFPDGEYLATAGCNKQVQVFTKDGVRLGCLGEEHGSWIWTIAIHPQGNSIVLGCQDGSLICYNVAFSTVHALYAERYAFRENMCDVIIQHLVSGQKVRIKCRDLVHKIAIYRNRLAVQLPERVVLYELNSAENQPMHYRVKEKISKKFECSLLVVCSQNLVLCQDKQLQSLDFTGDSQREWNMDSYIRYIKVTGGPPGHEGLLLGLKSGEVWRIFLDNALPILVATVTSSVRCLDINASRTKIAIVDDQGRLVVRDLLSDTMLYQQDAGVNSVAWNTHMDNMLAYSHTNGGLSVRVGNLPARSPQNMQGVIVGLTGPTAFCLRGNLMSNVPVALGATMWQFVEAGMFEEAHQVACLGVPTSDWEGLAQAALDAQHLKVARDAFVKVRNLPWLNLLEELQEKQKLGDMPKEVIQADILAFGGKFREAARLYQKSGQGGRALALYTDLKMFDLAQEFLKEGSSSDKKELVRLRAEWACSMHEPRAAAELLLAAGEPERAIEIVAEQGWADVLLDIGRRLGAHEVDALRLVASQLRRLKALPLAAEIYRKLGQESEVVQLHVEARDWTEAFRLAENLPQVQSDVYLKHATWLAETDDFLGAQQAYVKAGQPKEATHLLRNLAERAISERRYSDASYYTWLRAKQVIQLLSHASDIQPEVMEVQVNEFLALLKLATIYYAYSSLDSYLNEPFTTNPPLTLFNIGRFVANQIDKELPPKGVSMFTVFYTLASQAKVLGANKLNFQVNNKLQQFKAPEALQTQVDINFITSRNSAGGFNDPEELLPMCYRCSSYSTHLQGNRCPTCEQGFIFSFVSFEILPLVELHPENDIGEQEAERLLMAPPKSNESHPDAFTDIMVHDDQLNLEQFGATTLDRDALRAIDPRSVIVVKWPKPFKTRYYRNVIPDLLVTICPECYQAFHAEDFELQVLQKGHCPFCRTPAEQLTNCY